MMQKNSYVPSKQDFSQEMSRFSHNFPKASYVSNQAQMEQKFNQVRLKKFQKTNQDQTLIKIALILVFSLLFLMFIQNRKGFDSS